MSVYLIQTPRAKIRNVPINLEPAKKFGKIIPVLHEDVNCSQNTTLVLDKITSGLSSFSFKSDYVLWAIGDPLALVLTGVALSKRGMPFFNWLRYAKRQDPRSGQLSTIDIYYIPTRVILIPDKTEAPLGVAS